MIREARTEYRRVLAWYERQRAGLGDEFSAVARETLEMIENFPSAGEPVERLEGDSRIRKMAMRLSPITSSISSSLKPPKFSPSLTIGVRRATGGPG